MHLNTLKKTGLQCQKIKIEEKVQVHVSTVTNPYLTIIFMQVLFKIFKHLYPKINWKKFIGFRWGLLFLLRMK